MSSFVPVTVYTPEEIKSDFRVLCESAIKILGEEKLNEMMTESVITLMEDVEDMRDVYLRKNESSRPWEEIKKELQTQ